MTMTDAELRIIEFLMTSEATRPAELPDWMLALLEGDRPEELSHELITAASLMYIRRLHPGISFDTAQALIAEYAADRTQQSQCLSKPVAPATIRPRPRSEHSVDRYPRREDYVQQSVLVPVGEGPQGQDSRRAGIRPSHHSRDRAR